MKTTKIINKYFVVARGEMKREGRYTFYYYENPSKVKRHRRYNNGDNYQCNTKTTN